jgi:hypothetical protein
VLQYEIFLADIQAKRQNEFDLRCSLYFEAVDGGHQIRTDFIESKLLNIEIFYTFSILFFVMNFCSLSNNR